MLHLLEALLIVVGGLVLVGLVFNYFVPILLFTAVLSTTGVCAARLKKGRQ